LNSEDREKFSKSGVSRLNWETWQLRWALISPRINVLGKFGRSSGRKVRGRVSTIELSVSDGRGVDIEEEERETFLEVDPDTKIIW